MPIFTRRSRADTSQIISAWLSKNGPMVTFASDTSSTHFDLVTRMARKVWWWWGGRGASPPAAKMCRSISATRLERFRRDKGVGRLVVRSHHQLLLKKEKRARHAAHTSLEHANRWTHTVPRGQARPDAFPERPFPHPVPTQMQAIAIHATVHETRRAKSQP